MNKFAIAFSAIAIVAAAASAQAGPARDCVLEGTVYKSGQGDDQSTNVQFHSMEKYSEDSKCRVRHDEKLQFKLPADTRLEKAPSGSTVRYRYQEDGKGESQTKLISVGA